MLRRLLLTLSLLVAARLEAAVTYDNASTGENAGAGLTFSFTTGAGADRGLIVFVHTYLASGSGPIPSSVTYATVAMTQFATTPYGTADHERITAYKLAAPTSGTNDVVVTAAGAEETVATAVSVAGCDQTNFETDSDLFSTDAVTTSTITVTSATGELVVDGVAWFANAVTATVGADQTERINNNNGSGVNSIASSTQAGAASVVMSWGFSASENPGQIAIAVKEATAGAAAIRKLMLLGAGP